MEKYRKSAVWTGMFAVFLAGILFMNLSADTYMKREFLTLSKVLTDATGSSMKEKSYLYFICKRRIAPYLLLGILAASLPGKIWMILYGLWFCFTQGIGMTSAYLQNGIKGCWCMVLVQFPQMICYGMTYLHFMRKYLFWLDERKYAFQIDWLLYIPVMLSGIWMEFYVNPLWLSILKKWLW